MNHSSRIPTALAAISLILAAVCPGWAAGPAAPWRVLIANDNCPDVTWGYTEEQTRQAFADLVRSHLDEMARTDAGLPENRDHFNLATTQEAMDFVQHYPARKDELIRRIREGRICVSPFLCNSLWGFQSVEGALRTLYPARRLQRDWGLPMEVAEHIELPSLPWGQATLLAGCGVRWVSVPFLDYDCTFKNLQNPPLFRWLGPDGSGVNVVMDAWASRRANYSQGAHLLKEPLRVIGEWVPHYEKMGAAYPLRTIFASGTHSDISPGSWRQSRRFAEGIERYNATALPDQPRLVNGTLAQFCREVEAVENASPFLPELKGCFGHSWELWVVSLAKTAAALRQHERTFLAAESLVTLASQTRPAFAEQTLPDRRQAEWFWAMLSDHAWNGTDLQNKRHNAGLRRRWTDGLAQISHDLAAKSWQQLGLRAEGQWVTVFNPLSFPADFPLVCEAPPDAEGLTTDGEPVAAQAVLEDGQRRLAFVARRVPPFGFREFHLVRTSSQAGIAPFRLGDSELEGPFYRLAVDPKSGGLRSLVHKASGDELVRGASGRTLCQTVFFDGTEHLMSDVESKLVCHGAVLAQLRIAGRIGDIRLTNLVTLYATLDRVDFDLRIAKPCTTNEQRLLQFFPVGEGVKDLRLETTAAVLRPCLQPDGDLLPGADVRRFAVQGFVDWAAAGRIGVTIAPLDALMVRLDQGTLAFEALGNDQNWKEVTQDQDGVRQFRFRYGLRAHAPGYDNAATLAWSRSVSSPMMVAPGRIGRDWLDKAWLEVDPARALVTCFKPSDHAPAKEAVVRVWETAGTTGLLALQVPGYGKAQTIDLLERSGAPLALERNRAFVKVRGHGFAAVRLER
jgi:hypothetical protein